MIRPRIPGHETIGDVVAVGEGEKKWKVGDRVGAPWYVTLSQVVCVQPNTNLDLSYKATMLTPSSSLGTGATMVIISDFEPSEPNTHRDP